MHVCEGKELGEKGLNHVSIADTARSMMTSKGVRSKAWIKDVKKEERVIKTIETGKCGGRTFKTKSIISFIDSTYKSKHFYLLKLIQNGL